MDNGAGSYRRFLDGEKSALAEIVEQYREGLEYFIRRYVRDEQIAEDIAMDVFADLIVHPRRYDFRVSLKTYLYMLGRSRALNHLKRYRREETAEISEELPDDCAGNDPEEALLMAERRRELSRALDGLPEDMRTAVYLVYYEEMSYRDAARVMKKTVKQIDNLLYRAKERLRSVIGKDGVFSDEIK